MRKGGPPAHTDYNYYMYDFSGDVMCRVVLSEYLKDGIDILEDTYVLSISFPDEAEAEVMEPIKVTEEQFNRILAPVLNIGIKEVVWSALK